MNYCPVCGDRMAPEDEFCSYECELEFYSPGEWELEDDNEELIIEL